jgi:RNA binding exosome subunit
MRILSSMVGVSVLVSVMVMGSCTSTAIAVRESLGNPKREQLVDRVEDTREAQEGAKEQFATTLDELKALSGYDGGELEDAYSRLKKELDRSEDRANRVRKRIKDVEVVANKLFDEWREELDDYSTRSLRDASERQLEDTMALYARVHGAMKAAESKMDPVLAAFGDQVLFLKHNLNARAIASLDDSIADLRGEIEALIADMERSIDEANAFIDAMGAGGES